MADSLVVLDLRVGVRVPIPQPESRGRLENEPPFFVSPGVSVEGHAMGDDNGVTVVTWLFAPAWLSVEQAALLAGLPVAVVAGLASAGYVDVKTGADGKTLVSRDAWAAYLDTLEEVLTDGYE